MRLLHTSDWHLGRTLHGHSRAREHEAFLDELVEVAQDVDLVLIAGDVFETSNPPIEAEELLFDALARLGDGGRRAVVVIAGNHDSPDRLAAPRPLTTTHGVWILGRPGDVPRPRRGPGVELLAGAPGTLTLALPSGIAVVAALPYPSEARLAQVLSTSIEETDMQRAYEHRVREVLASQAQAFRPDAVNVVTSHLSMTACMPSSSERTLVGGAWQVAGDVLPAGTQYAALGHLHLAQAVPDAPCVARYAGSPLHLRFSEKDYPRHHVLIELEPGGEPQVELVPVAAGRPLVTWEVDGVAALEAQVADGLHPDAFVDLAVRTPTRLTHAEIARIKKLPRDIVKIRAILPEGTAPELEGAGRRDLPLSDVFRAFYATQTNHEPDPELVRLFLELAGESA
ncbi:MAG: exonuclease subunit SbcD [Alphaproteobacteria bacterium]|nr:exonuclease subunit SbcD [Alphaproteobacteria bacterium]